MEHVAHTTLTLRSLELTDFSQVLLWNDDALFCEVNEWPLRREETALHEWWKQCVENNRPEFHRIGIEWNDRLIGYIDFANMTEHSAELGIAIGDSSLWQKGLGSKAIELALEYGRKKFKVQMYTAETHVSNIRAQKMLRKLGFTEYSESNKITLYKLTLEGVNVTK